MIYDFEGHTPKIDPNSWVASNAVIIGKVELKKDSNIWFNVTLRGDVEPIKVGEGSNVQDGSVVHSDPGCPVIIGKNVTIKPYSSIENSSSGKTVRLSVIVESQP